MPWGDAITPAPKCATSLPLASNLSTGSSVDPTQLLAPHRSATQMLTPSLSMSTALVDPQVRPSGILAQPSTVWYGLGRSFTGAEDFCAPAADANAASANTATARCVEF